MIGTLVKCRCSTPILESSPYFVLTIGSMVDGYINTLTIDKLKALQLLPKERYVLNQRHLLLPVILRGKEEEV